mgnify:CR=1 FL=1
MKKILIVVAHPDDEILGMGGTIAKYASEGAEIALLIVTDGSTSQYESNPNLKMILENKKIETKRAADIVGITHIFYGGLPDMKLDMIEHIVINATIEKVINEFNPDIVYTHFEGDVNKDHQCVYQSTLVACRPTPGQKITELYSFSVPSSTEWSPQNSKTVFIPNVYIDIEGEFSQRKYSAMSEYETEIREYPHPRSIETLRILDQAVGLQVGLKCAESFIAHRVVK